MPKIRVLKDQSVIVCDTLSRQDSSVIVLKALEATPVYWSQERSQLDGNIDAGGTPGGGIPITNTDPPLVFIGLKAQLWARSPVDTFLAVEVMELNLETYVAARGASHTPGAIRQVKHTGPLPNYQDGWVAGRQFR